MTAKKKRRRSSLRRYADGTVPGVNWLQVTPEERKRLDGLVEHYRKMPHPFTACVRDNTKRFGPERARRVCAVLKDLIEGGTGWRKGSRKMADGSELVAVPEPYLTHDELVQVLDQAEAIMGERAYAFDPGQARAPKGTAIGGRWIKMAVLAAAVEQMTKSGPDNIQVSTPEEKRAAQDLHKSGDLAKSFGLDRYVITPKGQKTLADAQRADPKTPGRAPSAVPFVAKTKRQRESEILARRMESPTFQAFGKSLREATALGMVDSERKGWVDDYNAAMLSGDVEKEKTLLRNLNATVGALKRFPG